MRPSGRQGAGALGRTDQAPQHRPLPTRHHAGARHHRRAHRRRGRQPDRQPRRRARSAVPARRHQPQDPVLQVVLPGHDAQLLRRGRHRPQRASALRAARRRVRRRRHLAGAPRHSGSDRRGGHRRGSRTATIRSTTLRQGRVAVRRRLAGRRRAADLWRGRRRSARLPRAGGRAARHERRGMAQIRRAGVAVLRPGEGQGVGRRRRLGLRAGEDAGGLLPDPRRYSVCDRQIAGRRAVRRHPLDGDQDRRSRRRQAVRRRDPRRVPRQDAGLQPVPLVQLGHHRHERRRDARVPRGTRQDGIRLQLHDLRRTPGRRGRRRGVRHALRQDGMLALARLQRKMRLVESPYRTPQTLVGGPRSDAALAASSGRTATTKSMGEGSTQHQHLVQTEVPKKLLEEWLALWGEHYQLGEKLRVQLRPRRAGRRRAGARHLRRRRRRGDSSPTWSSTPSRTGTAAAS